MRAIIGILLFLMMQRCVVTGSGCQSDRNKDHRPRVSCVNQGLTAVPGGIDPLTQVLVLTENRFSSVSWSDYSPFLHLYELDLSHNQITVLEPPGPVLENLGVLRLSGNRLTGLGGEVFRCAPNLMQIYLDGNRIRSLHDATFSYLQRLEIINLSQNELPALPPRLLERVSSSTLKRFDLENNSVSLMPDGFFSSKPELPYVYLSYNPWLCSCAVGYLHSYLNDQDYNVYKHEGPDEFVPGTDTVLCAGPPHLNGRKIIKLEKNDFCPPEPTDPPPFYPMGDQDFKAADIIITTPHVPSTPLNTTLPAPIYATWPAPLKTTSFTHSLDTTLSAPLDTTSSAPPDTTSSTPLDTTSSALLEMTSSAPPDTTSSPPLYTNSSAPLDTTSSAPLVSDVPLDTTSSAPLIWTVPSVRTVPPDTTSPMLLESWTYTWYDFWTDWLLSTVTTAEFSSLTEVNVSYNTIEQSSILNSTQPQPQTATSPIPVRHIASTTAQPKPKSTSVGLHLAKGAGSQVVDDGRTLPWCWWLFVGFVLLCVLSALTSCFLFIWLLKSYLVLQGRLKRYTPIYSDSDGVTLRAYKRIENTASPGEENEESVTFLSLEQIKDVQAVFRSVLFISKGNDEGPKDAQIETKGRDALTTVSAQERAEGREDEELVFRKSLFREISQKEESNKWTEEEECWYRTRERTSRYRLVLRETTGSERNMEWVVGEWEMGERGVVNERSCPLIGQVDGTLPLSSSIE
nr:platelet glycoprotein Ib alpha chain [Misgurnus anguillicaudatus]